MKFRKLTAVMLAGLMTLSVSAPVLAADTDAAATETQTQQLQDGTYNADVTFDFRMMRMNPYYNNGKGTLTVQNGTENLSFTLVSTGYDRFYMGSVGDAQKASEDQLIKPETVQVYKGYDSASISKLKAGKKKITVTLKKNKIYRADDNAYQFTLPVTPGSNTVSFAVRGAEKGTWYSHTLTYSLSDTVNAADTELLANTTGYEVQYSLKNNFKSAKTQKINGASKKSAVIKKLKSKKTYYVRTRVVRSVAGETEYSDWSAAKKAKVK